MFMRRFNALLAPSDDGSAGGAAAGAGAGAGATDGGAGAAGAGGGNGAAGGAGGLPGSVLASGGAAAAAGGAAAGAAGVPADPNAWLPEKHRVFGQDGKTLDLEASARKVAEAYGHAERRIGSGDVAPAKVDDYKVNVPEALAEKIKAEDLAADAGFKEFMAKAHAAGLTQKQLDTVVGEFLDRSVKLQGGIQRLSEQEATTQLRETWKTDAEFTQGVQAAFRAGQQYAGKDFDGILNDYGNDPRIVRMLAAVGKEMGEDTSAPAGAQANFQADLETLTKSKAYTDPAHPDHTATKQKVAAMFERQYGSRPKQAGPIVFSAS